MLNKPLKIVLLSYHNQNGGAGIACGRLQVALQKAGHEVHWIVQEKSGNDQSISLTNTWLKKILSWMDFIFERLYFFPNEKDKSIRFLFNPGIFGHDISQNAYIKQADIIHMHWINFGFLSIQNIKQLLALGKPVVWTLHDMWAFTGGCHHSGTCDHYTIACGNCHFLNTPKASDVSYDLWSKKMHAFDHKNLHIITCSAWLKNRAAHSSILKHRSITAIPNAINTTDFKPNASAKEIAGLDPLKTYILFVAMRINAPKKGFEYLKKALEIYAKSNPSAEVLIVGNANEIPNLALKSHHVGHIAHPQDMIKYYQAADVFITPSLEENLPNTIMEALACGTPCVGFQVGGIPEMIDHKINGFIADFQDADQLAEGIAWCVQAKPRDAARSKALGMYDEAIIAAQHVKLYTDVSHA